MAKDKGLYSQS